MLKSASPHESKFNKIKFKNGQSSHSMGLYNTNNLFQRSTASIYAML